MKDFLFIGFIVCIFAFGVVVGALACTDKYVTPLIKQCEAELPRDQHCKLTAVPEDEK